MGGGPPHAENQFRDAPPVALTFALVLVGADRPVHVVRVADDHGRHFPFRQDRQQSCPLPFRIGRDEGRERGGDAEFVAEAESDPFFSVVDPEKAHK